MQDRRNDPACVLHFTSAEHVFTSAQHVEPIAEHVEPIRSAAAQAESEPT